MILDLVLGNIMYKLSDDAIYIIQFGRKGGRARSCHMQIFLEEGTRSEGLESAKNSRNDLILL